MATKAKVSAEPKETAKKATEKVVTKVTEPKAETAKPKTTTKSKNAPSHEDIRQKAYEIFLKTGNHNEHENWVQAEIELQK